MTRLARSSSMKVGRKMMRSFRRREKMSNARSPRGVCSTTIGTKPIGDLLFIGSPPDGGALDPCGLARSGLDSRVGDQEVEGHAIADTLAQSLEVAAILHHTTESRRRPLAGVRQVL